MAGIIATEALAAAIGGGSSYTSNLMVTRTRAVALGCSIRNTYANNLLVCHGDLYKPGYTYCTCNAQCTCNLVCTSVSGKTTCTCNSECSCKSLLTWCECKTHCTCNVKIDTFSCPYYQGSITQGSSCSSFCVNTGGNPGFSCNIWCYQNYCYTNTCSSVYGYSGSNWCLGHCFAFKTCSCNTQCTCNTKAGANTCACNTYCSCNSNGCTCLGHCTCNTVCGCDKHTCDCLSQCSCVGHCTCNSVS